MKSSLNEKIYATLKKHFSTKQLQSLGFVADGSRMVKRGARRVEYAQATSLDGTSWRVTPYVRHWR
jgi:hypothetical protein